MSPDEASKSLASGVRRHGTEASTGRSVLLVAWYALGAVIVYVVPSLLWLGGAPWSLASRDEMQAWYWVTAFLITAVGLARFPSVGTAASFLTRAFFVVAVWAAAYGALSLRPDVSHSRVLAAISGLLGIVLVMVPDLRFQRIALLAVPAVAAVLGVMQFAKRGEPPVQEAQRRFINSALVGLQATSGVRLDTTGTRGGAITPMESGVLLVTAAGDWYEAHFDSTRQQLAATRLSIPAPMERAAALKGPGRRPWMRVTGLVIDTTSGTKTVYVAHETWRDADSCVAIQISAMRLDGLNPVDSAWQRVYTTEPCITPVPPFDKFETGGALALHPDGSLLLTTSDWGLSTDSTSPPLSQSLEGDYGKVLKIGRDGRRTLFSLGHRNPTGIVADRGSLWLVEQGPRGGDEINLLRPMANYGWPAATYGTAYGSYRWRFSEPTATHGTFAEPVLALVPALALSSVVAIRGNMFGEWRGDLLAGSLAGNALLRIRTLGERVVYTETIEVGRRIRGLAESGDGRIVLWTDDGGLIAVSAARDVVNGGALYERHCKSCHSVPRELGSASNPGMKDVVGRDVASLDVYQYSEALKRVGGTWTPERLDAFLTNPEAFAPGNNMRFGGLADRAERHAIVEYIRHFR